MPTQGGIARLRAYSAVHARRSERRGGIRPKAGYYAALLRDVFLEHRLDADRRQAGLRPAGGARHAEGIARLDAWVLVDHRGAPATIPNRTSAMRSARAAGIRRAVWHTRASDAAGKVPVALSTTPSTADGRRFLVWYSTAPRQAPPRARSPTAHESRHRLALR